MWRLEEAYRVHVKNNDIASYLTLWDDGFLGWPGFSRTPVEKNAIIEWIPPLHANPLELYDYILERESVRSFGEVVVAHYLVHQIFRSAETGEALRDEGETRITHTWQRRGNSWQIITGMSGTLIEETSL